MLCYVVVMVNWGDDSGWDSIVAVVGVCIGVVSVVVFAVAAVAFVVVVDVLIDTVVVAYIIVCNTCISLFFNDNLACSSCISVSFLVRVFISSRIV